MKISAVFFVALLSAFVVESASAQLGSPEQAAQAAQALSQMRALPAQTPAHEKCDGPVEYTLQNVYDSEGAAKAALNVLRDRVHGQYIIIDYKVVGSGFEYKLTVYMLPNVPASHR